MSPQADYVVANGTGAAVRSDINGQLAAIVSNNSGASAPATTYAYQFWADTSTNLLKLRNGANSAWITVGDLTAANLGLASLASPTFTGTVTIPTLTVSTGANIPLGTAASPTLYFTGDTNTGLYSPGADQLALTTGGTGRLFITSAGSVGIGTSSPSFGVGDGLEVARSGVATVRVSSNTQGVELRSDGGTGTLETRGAFPLVLGTGGTERARIDSSGRVGIGTTNPTSALHIDVASGEPFRFRSQAAGSNYFAHVNHAGGGDLAYVGAGGGAALNSGTTSDYAIRANQGALLFGTNGNNERARIDSSGRLLVGTSSTSASALLTVQGSSSAAAGAANINIQRGTAATSIVADNVIGQINFGDSSANAFANISCSADAAAGTNDYPGRLSFSTTADGASSPTERMRIANNGTIFFHRTQTGTFDLPGTHFDPDGGTYFCRSDNPPVHVSRTTGNGDAVRFFRGSTTQVGGISVTTTSTAFNTSSDYRLKENVTAVFDGITRLQQLKPSRFNFIADPDKTVDGFIAHEVQAVVPEAINGEKDAENENGNPVYQGIDQSKLVPLLTAALQEAIAKIESLEARLTAAGI